MTTKRQDRAGKYLQSWLQHEPDLQNLEEEHTVFLTNFFDLADQDFADCATDDQRRKVWAGITAALLDHLNSLTIDSSALRMLHDNLVNNALLRPPDVRLGAGIIGKSKPLETDWIRALVVALWDQYPDDRLQLATDCSEFTDMQAEAVPKFVENFKSGLVGGEQLKALVQTARKQIEDSGTKRIKTHIKHRPKSPHID